MEGNSLPGSLQSQQKPQSLALKQTHNNLLQKKFHTYVYTVKSKCQVTAKGMLAYFSLTKKLKTGGNVSVQRLLVNPS